MKTLYDNTRQTIGNPLIIPTMSERLKKGTTAPEQLVSNALLTRESITLFGGAEDSFKSFLMCQLSVCLASGSSWLGHSCRQCNTVVYLVMEGGDDYILERIESIACELGQNLPDVFARIRVVPYLYEPLDMDEAPENLYAALKEVNPDVVICDPVTYQMSQDVRYSPTMTRLGTNLLKIARDLNTAVVAVLHTKKNSQNSNDMDDFIGSSILKDMAASRIKVFRQEDKQMELYAKTRYAERPDTIKLVFKYPVFDVVEEVAKPRAKAMMGVTDYLERCGQEVLGILVEMVKQAQTVNEKTVRAVISALEVEGLLKIEPMPGSARKLVKWQG